LDNFISNILDLKHHGDRLFPGILIGLEYGKEDIVQSLHKKLPKNIDDVNSVILSKASGYQLVGKPVISLTDR
jgi:hypothetical protein